MGRSRAALLIVADTSAIVAIAFGENERALFLGAIERADKTLISSVTVVESKMVVHARRGPRAVRFVDDLFQLPTFGIVPPGFLELDAAYSAFATFGKGSGHPAALNFGDVFSYALAKVRGLPLLYKGDDFGRTDITNAVRP